MLARFHADLVPLFQELLASCDTVPGALLELKEKLKTPRDEEILSALAGSTLRAVRRAKLFEVWDDNCGYDYTGHTARFRQVLPRIAEAALSGSGFKDQKKVNQILACYVALYNGPLTEGFLGEYQHYHKDRIQQRTLYIGKSTKYAAHHRPILHSNCIHL